MNPFHLLFNCSNYFFTALGLFFHSYGKSKMGGIDIMLYVSTSFLVTVNWEQSQF